MDLLVISGVSLIFLLLSLAWARSVNLGRALNATQRKMLLYGFFFVFGEGSLMALANRFQLSDPVMFFLIAGWGALLAALALWTYKHRRPKPESAEK